MRGLEVPAVSELLAGLVRMHAALSIASSLSNDMSSSTAGNEHDPLPTLHINVVLQLRDHSLGVIHLLHQHLATCMPVVYAQ